MKKEIITLFFLWLKLEKQLDVKSLNKWKDISLNKVENKIQLDFTAELFIAFINTLKDIIHLLFLLENLLEYIRYGI